MRLGRFITFEGGEGTGKSTLVAGLAGALRARHLSCLTTREPGGTPLAETIRDLALNPPEGQSWSPLAQALLMNAAREDHLIRQIRPALNKGFWVLCDRFADSTRVYQGLDGVAAGILMSFEKAVVGETVPDLTIILDAPPHALQERRSLRGVSDAFESRDLSFHNGVRAAFLEIARADKERCIVLDALQAPQDLCAQALSVLQERFGL